MKEYYQMIEVLNDYLYGVHYDRELCEDFIRRLDDAINTIPDTMLELVKLGHAGYTKNRVGGE